MTTLSQLEERVAALEKDVAKLQAESTATAPNWLDKVIGSVTDSEAFAEMLEYGKEFRYADKPKDADGDGE